MCKRQVQIERLEDLEVEIHLLGSSSWGESILVLITDKGFVLFSYLIDSFKGIHDYLKSLKEKEVLQSLLTCICWTHPHDDHSDDLLSILQDDELVRLNKKCPLQYEGFTRFIIPGYLKNGKYKIQSDYVEPILSLGGAIGVVFGEYHSNINHSWSIKINETYTEQKVSLNIVSPKVIEQSLSQLLTKESLNLISLSCVLQIGSLYSIYFGGDCTDDELIGIMNGSTDKHKKMKNLITECKIIKIPHHGSDSTVQFIDYLNDNLDYAIVTSDCRTSLPNQDVLDKYSSKLGKNGRVLCTSSFVTDEQIGEIVIKIRFDSKGLPILSDNTNSNNNDIEWYNFNQLNNMQTLQINNVLQGGRYRIVETLGQGGFGITYLAIQSGLERKVAIKEFFMKEFCERDEATSHVTLGTESNRETVNRFREKFLKEARNIARLNHPNIIRIFDVFEENGTAYYVMEYCENGSLADKVKREGALSEAVATHYILQVADALNYIHRQKMNHLDVKPANILLNEKDEAVLIDFGLSKQYDVVTGSQTSTTPVGISNGYAPMEQYRPGGVSEFSPQTDIYSLGATFFMLLTGITPPSASDINEDGVPVDELKANNVKRKTISVICKAMKGRKKERLQDITSFVERLKGWDLSEVSGVSSASKPVSKVDDEATVAFVNSKKEEDERKRKEAEPRAKAKEEFGILNEAGDKLRNDAGKNSSKGFSYSWLWLVAIIVVACIIGLNSIDSDKPSPKSRSIDIEKSIADSIRIADSIVAAWAAEAEAAAGY